MQQQLVSMLRCQWGVCGLNGVFAGCGLIGEISEGGLEIPRYRTGHGVVVRHGLVIGLDNQKGPVLVVDVNGEEKTSQAK